MNGYYSWCNYNDVKKTLEENDISFEERKTDYKKSILLKDEDLTIKVNFNGDKYSGLDGNFEYASVSREDLNVEIGGSNLDIHINDKYVTFKITDGSEEENIISLERAHIC